MITVTSLHEQPFVINADLIESIEQTPDTMIRMTTGKKIVVRESVDDVVARVVEFKRRCFMPVVQASAPPPQSPPSP